MFKYIQLFKMFSLMTLAAAVGIFKFGNNWFIKELNLYNIHIHSVLQLKWTFLCKNQVSFV